MAEPFINPPARRRPTAYQAFLSRNPEFASEVGATRLYLARELRKLSERSGVWQRDRVRILLRDRRLQRFYAFQALRRSHRLQDASVDHVSALASRWNPFAVHDEPVQIFSLPERLRHRRVVSFGPIRRMHQLMLADLLKILHPPGPEQFLFNRGMPAALAAVEAAICRDGYDFGCEVDIEHFYQSIRPLGLAELLRPVPVSVVTSVIWDTGIRRRVDGDPTSWSASNPSLSGLVGLAAGAATSPIVGEKIIARIIAGSRNVRLVTYADNIFVLGRSEGDVQACLQHLSSTAERLETGPLRLRIGEIHQFRGTPRFIENQPFSFLHHEGHLSAEAREIEWRPDQRKIDEYLLAHEDAPLTEQQIAAMETKITHWRRAYPGWSEGHAFEARQLAALAAKRFYQSADATNLTRAAHALVVACFLSDVMPFEELAPAALNANQERRRGRLIDSAQALFQMMRAIDRRAISLS